MAPESDTIVVVGGGLASARFATEYRAAGGEAPVTILSSEEDPPYHRPPLTKGFLRGEVERDGTYVRPAEEYEDEVVELRLGVRAERIDPEKHAVVLEGGDEVRYATLVLATGARPRPLPLPGADLVGVHTYRSLADAEAVSAAAEEAHSAIVIGGSFIGSETAASLRSCITTSKGDSHSTQASRCERQSPMSPMKTRPTSTSRPAIRMPLRTGCWAAATFWSCVTRSSSPRWKNANDPSAQPACDLRNLGSPRVFTGRGIRRTLA